MKKLLMAASTAFALSATVCSAKVGDSIDREQLDRLMGSADTCMIDDGHSVRRTSSASLRDCFDKIRQTALDNITNDSAAPLVTGDAYKHGRAIRSFQCGTFDDSENFDCRETFIPF